MKNETRFSSSVAVLASRTKRTRKNIFRGTNFSDLLDLSMQEKSEVITSCLVQILSREGIEYASADGFRGIQTEKHVVQFKLACESKAGRSIINQIRPDDDCDFMLVISPKSSGKCNLWFIPQSVVLENAITGQHASDPSRTRMVNFDPYDEPAWMRPYGNDFDSVISQMTNILR